MWPNPPPRLKTYAKITRKRTYTRVASSPPHETNDGSESDVNHPTKRDDSMSKASKHAKRKAVDHTPPPSVNLGHHRDGSKHESTSPKHKRRMTRKPKSNTNGDGEARLVIVVRTQQDIAELDNQESEGAIANQNDRDVRGHDKGTCVDNGGDGTETNSNADTVRSSAAAELFNALGAAQLSAKEAKVARAQMEASYNATTGAVGESDWWRAKSILQCRGQGEATLYYVAWEGKDPETGLDWPASWEPESNLGDDLIADFRARQANHGS